MRVLLTTDRVHGFGAIQRNGEIVDLDEQEALALIRARQAELIETAMDEPRQEFAAITRKVIRRSKHGLPA